MCPAQPGSKYCPSVKPGPDAGVECLEYSRKLYGTFGADVTTIGFPNTTAPVGELYNVIFGIAQPWAHAFAVTPGYAPNAVRIALGPPSLEDLARALRTLRRLAAAPRAEHRLE